MKKDDVKEELDEIDGSCGLRDRKDDGQVQISGSLLARNSLLNPIGKDQQAGLLAKPLVMMCRGEASWATV